MREMIEFTLAFVMLISMFGFIFYIAHYTGKMSAKREISKYKQALEDSIKREEIARKVIEDKNKKYKL